MRVEGLWREMPLGEGCMDSGANVAAAILAAVEPGILPGGWKHALYVRQDARRYDGSWVASTTMKSRVGTLNPVATDVNRWIGRRSPESTLSQAWLREGRFRGSLRDHEIARWDHEPERPADAGSPARSSPASSSLSAPPEVARSATGS